MVLDYAETPSKFERNGYNKLRLLRTVGLFSGVQRTSDAGVKSLKSVMAHCIPLCLRLLKCVRGRADCIAAIHVLAFIIREEPPHHSKSVRAITSRIHLEILID